MNTEQKKVTDSRTVASKDWATASARPENVRVITDQGICPQIGQLIRVHDQSCKIVAVHDFGTVDVECPSGRYWWRVTGLPFLKP